MAKPQVKTLNQIELVVTGTVEHGAHKNGLAILMEAIQRGLEDDHRIVDFKLNVISSVGEVIG